MLKILNRNWPIEKRMLSELIVIKKSYVKFLARTYASSKKKLKHFLSFQSSAEVNTSQTKSNKKFHFNGKDSLKL